MNISPHGPAPAAITSLPTALGVLGALLLVGVLAGASGRRLRALLPLPALFLIAGIALGRGGAGVLRFGPGSAFVIDVATVALIVVLLRDGLEVERELLARRWHLPLRKLVIAMPITLGIVAVAARGLLGLSWSEALLLGALLSPTDPVLSSTVVTDARVPALVRHSLNLESGFNDGLALPAVLVFMAALDPAEPALRLQYVAQDIGLGLVYGAVCGLAAAELARRLRGRGESAQRDALLALGGAFATYGLTFAGPHGNGLIAVFTFAIALGARAPHVRVAFARRSGEIVEVAKLGVFVVFGSLLTLHGLFGGAGAGAGATGGAGGLIALVAIVLLVARPLAVALALAGSRLRPDVRAFMAWFGPKGVATMTFSLLVLASDVRAGRYIFDAAALVVCASALAHGLTAEPGVRRLADRVGGRRPGGGGGDGAAVTSGASPVASRRGDAWRARRPTLLRGGDP